MTKTIAFSSDFGDIFIAANDASIESSSLGNAVVTPLSTGGQEFLIKASKSFEAAMQPAVNYADAVRKMLESMDKVPSEITLEIGLALKGTAGFAIVGLETAADIKLSLKWNLDVAGN